MIFWPHKQLATKPEKINPHLPHPGGLIISFPQEAGTDDHIGSPFPDLLEKDGKISGIVLPISIHLENIFKSVFQGIFISGL